MNTIAERVVRAEIIFATHWWKTWPILCSTKRWKWRCTWLGPCCVNDNWTSNCHLDNCRPTANCDFKGLIGLNEWDSLKIMFNNIAKKIRERAHHYLRQEDGNVESALVLIPMLILFLISAQLIVATNIRNTEMALAQGDASARAISHMFQPGDEVIEVGGRIERFKFSSRTALTYFLN